MLLQGLGFRMQIEGQVSYQGIVNDNKTDPTLNFSPYISGHGLKHPSILFGVIFVVEGFVLVADVFSDCPAV